MDVGNVALFGVLVVAGALWMFVVVDYWGWFDESRGWRIAVTKAGKAMADPRANGTVWFPTVGPVDVDAICEKRGIPSGEYVRNGPSAIAPILKGRGFFWSIPMPCLCGSPNPSHAAYCGQCGAILPLPLDVVNR